MKPSPYAVIYFFVSLLFHSCKEEPYPWDLPPNTSAYIGFSDTSVWQSKYPLDSLHAGIFIADSTLVYYRSNAKKEYVKAFITSVQYGPQGEPFYPYYALGIPNIAERSSVNNVKTYYIDWPLGSADTLYADYFRFEHSDDRFNNCDCSDPLNQLLLNGKVFIEDTDYTENGVYVFE